MLDNRLSDDVLWVYYVYNLVDKARCSCGGNISTHEDIHSYSQDFYASLFFPVDFLFWLPCMIKNTYSLNNHNHKISKHNFEFGPLGSCSKYLKNKHDSGIIFIYVSFTACCSTVNFKDSNAHGRYYYFHKVYHFPYNRLDKNIIAL